MDIPKTYYKWTDESELVLVQCVNEHPTNIKQAMIQAGELLGIDYQKCKSRWYGSLNKKVNNIPTLNAIEDSSQIPTSQKVRESLDSFLESLKVLQKRNKVMEQQLRENERRIIDQQRIIRDMTIERKDLEESYTYILKVMEKARKMFVEEERGEGGVSDNLSAKTYIADSRGNIEMTKNNVG